MSQPKLTLRPPPHRDFVQGFPGIAASSTCPPSHIAGTVEVRLGTKGLKAAWLRIELRKLETLPGGEIWGELIGKGPIHVWTAKKDEAYKSQDENGWEILQTADFPFQVAIPEGLPPSAKLEKQAGIAYELVTSLCVKSKKGLLRKETTSSIIQNTHPIWLDKHELHSTWPVYHVPDEHEATQDDVKVKLFRSQTCYGPGDQVEIRIIVASDRVSPVKLKSLSFAVRETVTFKGGIKKSFGSKSAASQKTENLASKNKTFGKKIYKGDYHTFDLNCQIPKAHSLMTIQTAKHIEVSYTMRVQVDLGKKPIVIDHLPLTVSSFAKSVSETTIQCIGFVPSLSSVSSGVTASQASALSPVPSSAAQASGAAVTRSQSFASSTFSATPYTTLGDLQRRDTVMTQGTAVSGPGMAGRGVPNQIFSWGQYGSAQPFDAPRSAFAGPPSIFEGNELQPEENRALFHSTNRPQSAYILGANIDPVLLPSHPFADIQSHPRRVSPIQEEGQLHTSQPNVSRIPPQRQRSLSNPITTNSYQNQSIPPQLHAGMSNSAETEKERLYERARQQAERNQRRADERRAQAAVAAATLASGLAAAQHFTPTPASQPQSVAQQRSASAPMAPFLFRSAADEKERLFEKDRAEAEHYQASFPQGAQFPSSASVPLANASSNATDARRTSANYWIDRDASSSSSTAPSGTATPTEQRTPNAQFTPATVSTIVSGRPAPYPSYMSAEEEKLKLYERAKAETEAFQRAETTPSQQGHQHEMQSTSTSQAGHFASFSSSSSSSAAYGHLPGGWSGDTGSTSSPSNDRISHSNSHPSTLVQASLQAATSAANEKEQLRRYYDAQDAVARHISFSGGQPAASGSGPPGIMQNQPPSHYQNGSGAFGTPEVSEAVTHATPHQPVDTLAANRFKPASIASTLPTPTQSYLTQSEQESAREKERLATRYAKKAANAAARAQAQTSSSSSSAAVAPTVTQSNSFIQPGTSNSSPVPWSSPFPNENTTNHGLNNGSLANIARPAAEYPIGYESNRTVSQSNAAALLPRRTSSVMGGRPLPTTISNQSPSTTTNATFPNEKAQMAAYYAAKDSVEARSITTTTLSPKQDQGPTTWLPPIDTHLDLSFSSPPPPPSSTSTTYTRVFRDPEILAGKQRAPSSIRSPSQSMFPSNSFSIPQHDPNLWRPKYDWLDQQDDQDDKLQSVPPLPPKIPLTPCLSPP